MPKHRFILRHRYALGDTVLLTGLVRDIHRAYPNTYEINVDTHWTPIWVNNPYVTRFDKQGSPKPQLIDLSWGEAITTHSLAKTAAGLERKHILAWYHYNFEKKTGLRIPVTAPRPDLHLSDTEKIPLIAGRYWVVMGGGKLDMTNKHWEYTRYQQVIDRLTPYGLSFVQCGATHSSHIHPPLNNCLNMVGRTDNVRDLFNIILHAEGVIGPVTGAMHIAAAFERPCVVLAGGREEPWFEHYGNHGAFGVGANPVKLPHQFLHTLGLLYCCQAEGCWKTRVVPIEPDDLTKNARKLCKEPLRRPGLQAIPKCMDMITVDHVVEAVMSYYESGMLPPIGTPKFKYPDVVSPAPAAVVAEPGPAAVVPDLGLPATLLPPGPPAIRIPIMEIQRGPMINIAPPAVKPAPPVQVRAASLPPLPQKPYQTVPPAEIVFTGSQGVNFDALDHPTIGGKYTVCVLCWGPHTDLAKKCLGSILNSIPRNRIDLRVACNECPAATIEYVRQLAPNKLYINSENRKKYPTMREMFWDSRSPISTKYVVWFDDDTSIADPLWALKLTEAIVANHPHGSRMYGMKLFHDLRIYHKDGHRPTQWFTEAPWWQGVNLRLPGTEKTAPNGSCIDFASGWFWALATETIYSCNIPDVRLSHNGGDCCIGAQIHQGGFKIKDVNKGKCLVTCPKKEAGGRRGFSEAFPWADPNTRANHISGT